MLETELFALLEQTADAAYTVTEGGEICSWNGAAERLFGYSASEVLHRNIDEVLEARDTLGTSALAGGSEAATRSEEHTSELQSLTNLVCRLLLEKKNTTANKLPLLNHAKLSAK